jgi:hypothetical protein
MTGLTQYDTGQGTATQAACLQRLATALSGYDDLDVQVRPNGPSPCLAACNTAAPLMAETVTVSASGDGLAFMWSWGQLIGDASDPDSAADAIAYVLEARGARLSPGSSSSGH